jgi:hypothetical protein
MNPLALDPNCGCFHPQTTQILNPKAWADAPAGTFGVSAPFYNNYRWQRQPAESMSFGWNFRMGREVRYNLSVRAEFQNAFNRPFLSMRTVGGAVNSPTSISSKSPGLLARTALTTTDPPGIRHVPTSDKPQKASALANIRSE